MSAHETCTYSNVIGLAGPVIAPERDSLEPYRAVGIALKGELAIAGDEPEAGLDFIRSALGTLRSQQYNLLITGFIGASAEGLRKTGNSRRRCSRSMEPLRARQIAAWNFTCLNCFGSNHRFSQQRMTVNQP